MKQPPSSRQAVAAEVRAAMGRANINQGALASKIGLSPAALSERLNCKRAFNTDHLTHIADVLGIDPVTLLRAPAA